MGQMGNQLFYYNNLVQIANKFNHDFKSPNFTNNDLFNLISPLENTQHLVFDEYIKDYGTEKGIYEFSTNYRLLYKLRTNDDFLRETGELPTFPEIRQVPTKPVEEVNLEDLKF